MKYEVIHNGRIIGHMTNDELRAWLLTIKSEVQTDIIIENIIMMGRSKERGLFIKRCERKGGRT